MRTAVLGGTFDPVHNGHLHLLHCVLAQGFVERVIIVPTRVPPHKPFLKRVEDSDRVAMLNLALRAFRSAYPECAGVDLVIDTCELERQEPSYMYDTVIDVNQRYPIEGKPLVVIGDDLVAGLPTWHRFDELKTKVAFIIVMRDSKQISEVPDGVEATFVENETLEVSSTAIRRAISSGNRSFAASLMPRSVVDYIQRHGLYRD